MKPLLISFLQYLFVCKLRAQETEDINIPDCAAPCLNEGECRPNPLSNISQCVCPSSNQGGFTGIQCETIFFECGDPDAKNWRCFNGGVCKENNGCTCPDGFEGDDCKTKSEAIGSANEVMKAICTNACINGGECKLNSSIGVFYCDCKTTTSGGRIFRGFTGDQCEKKFDACDGDRWRCYNGGVCGEDGACTCYDGFGGVDCKYKIEDIQGATCATPCMHGGQCMLRSENTSYCNCQTVTEDGMITRGFEGRQCEGTFITCDDQNGKTWHCSDGKECGVGASNCKDKDMENGNTNEIPEASCASSCMNGGECKYWPLTKTSYCNCPYETEDTRIVRGFMGKQCETRFILCDDHNGKNWHCYNGGVCGEDGSCTCSNGFGGKLCEDKDEENGSVNEPEAICDLPCENGGKCRIGDDGTGPYCDCEIVNVNGMEKGGFEGDRCEKKYTQCDDHNGANWRCHNSGVCGEDGSCICYEGFGGKYCKNNEENGNVNEPEAICTPPCENGGTCRNHADGTGPYCGCEIIKVNGKEKGGFEGHQCEKKYTQCDDHNGANWRCHNSGVCGEDGSCTCSNGFGGKYCKHIDEENGSVNEPEAICDLPCDRGTCRIGTDGTGPYCDCEIIKVNGREKFFFEGDRCEKMYTLCDNENGENWRCHNSGVCGEDASCTCNNGFGGKDCKTEPFCDLPCDGGTCRNHADGTGPYCDCEIINVSGKEKGGFEGDRCEKIYTLCDDDTGANWRCHNSGVCGEDGSCTCSNGYGGKYCKHKGEENGSVNEPEAICTPPCENGGTCKNPVDGTGPRCDCPYEMVGDIKKRGYQGYQCEIQFTFCDDQNGADWRCYNGGVCGDDGLCLCYPGFGGKHCKEKVEAPGSINSDEENTDIVDGSILEFSTDTESTSTDTESTSNEVFPSGDDIFENDYYGVESDDAVISPRLPEKAVGIEFNKLQATENFWIILVFGNLLILFVFVLIMGVTGSIRSICRNDGIETQDFSSPEVLGDNEMVDIPITPAIV